MMKQVSPVPILQSQVQMTVQQQDATSKAEIRELVVGKALTVSRGRNSFKARWNVLQTCKCTPAATKSNLR